jgi:predicted  nucleic acid-binding Zn-ribbon protein
LLGYKKTTEDITELDKEIQAKQDRYDLLDKQLTANERELIGFTNSIKNDFNDILK